jgi:hypothetical protein
MISLPIPENFGSSVHSIIYPPPIDTCLSNIFPRPLSKAVASRALQHSDIEVKYASGKQTIASFEKLEKVIEYAQKLENNSIKLFKINGEELRDYQRTWNDWRNSLLFKFRELLPDVQIIIAMRISSADNMNKTENSIINAEDITAVFMDLVKYYIIYNRDLTLESKYDFGKLFSDTDYLTTDDLKCKFVDIFSALDEFKWWNKDSKDSKSHLMKMIEMYFHSESASVLHSLKRLFRAYFTKSFLFQGYSFLDTVVWDIVYRHRTNAHLADLLSNTICDFQKNPFSLIDKMLEFKNSCSFIENADLVDELPFPPFVLAILNQIHLNDIVHFERFICDLILELCPSGGRIIVCRSYAALLEQVLKKNEAYPVRLIWIEHLVNWLHRISSCNIKRCNFQNSLDWKHAKSILKKTEKDNIYNQLIQISPTSFKDNWTRLISRFFPEDHSSVFTYLQLSGDENIECLNGEFFRLFGQRASLNWLLCNVFSSLPWILESIFQDKQVFEQTNSGKSWDLFKTRFNEMEHHYEVVIIAVNTLFFWIESWIARKYSEKTPAVLAADYVTCIIGKVQKFGELLSLVSARILEHPFLLEAFLSELHSPELSFGIFNINSAIIRIISLCSTHAKEQWVPFKKQLLENVKDVFSSVDESRKLVFKFAFKNLMRFLNEDEIKTSLKYILQCEQISTDLLEFILEIMTLSYSKASFAFPASLLHDFYLKSIEMGESSIFELIKSPKVQVGEYINGLFYPTEIVQLISHKDLDFLLKIRRDPSYVRFACWLAENSILHLRQFLPWLKENYKVMSHQEIESSIESLGGILYLPNGNVRMEGSKEFSKVLYKLCKKKFGQTLDDFRGYFDSSATRNTIMNVSFLNSICCSVGVSFLGPLSELFQKFVGVELDPKKIVFEAFCVCFQVDPISSLESFKSVVLWTFKEAIRAQKMGGNSNSLSKLLDDCVDAFNQCYVTINNLIEGFPIDKTVLSLLKYQFTNPKYLVLLTKIIPAIKMVIFVITIVQKCGIS